jgi:hypothetical protein
MDCLVDCKKVDEITIMKLRNHFLRSNREKLRREMNSLYEETYWCPPRFLGVLRDNTLKNLF